LIRNMKSLREAGFFIELFLCVRLSAIRRTCAVPHGALAYALCAYGSLSWVTRCVHPRLLGTDGCAAMRRFVRLCSVSTPGR
ncbi:MAG: hypothetical protein IJU23_13750, partial [Proteobacteria bacterium]|nr:hypothetical protein [Pseudomonadota bacterium]